MNKKRSLLFFCISSNQSYIFCEPYLSPIILNDSIHEKTNVPSSGRVGLWATSYLHDQSIILSVNNRMFLESAVFQYYIIHRINCRTRIQHPSIGITIQMERIRLYINAIFLNITAKLLYFLQYVR